MVMSARSSSEVWAIEDVDDRSIEILMESESQHDSATRRYLSKHIAINSWELIQLNLTVLTFCTTTSISGLAIDCLLLSQNSCFFEFILVIRRNQIQWWYLEYQLIDNLSNFIRYALSYEVLSWSNRHTDSTSNLSNLDLSIFWRSLPDRERSSRGQPWSRNWRLWNWAAFAEFVK